MTNKKHKDYEVGYCKPPKKNQFKPGQSGNPKGRPKNPCNPTEAIAKELSEYTYIEQNGKRIKMKKMDALARLIINNALRGDKQLIKMLFNSKMIDAAIFKWAFNEYNPEPKKNDPPELTPATKAALLGIRKLMAEKYEEEFGSKSEKD